MPTPCGFCRWTFANSQWTSEKHCLNSAKCVRILSSTQSRFVRASAPATLDVPSTTSGGNTTIADADFATVLSFLAITRPVPPSAMVVEIPCLDPQQDELGGM